MLKSLFGGALFGKRQKGEEWSSAIRWIRTSTTQAFSAEQELLETFLPSWDVKNIYIDLPKYGVQFINTYVLKGKEGEGEAQRAAVEEDYAVVMTHGFGGGAGMFYKTLGYLDETSFASRRRVYAIDWLGMGRSSRPSSGLMSGKAGFPARSAFTRKQAEEVSDEAIDYFVNSLEHWREAMNIQKLALVGHSLGGYLSGHYALRYPDRVAKLILLSPAGIPALPEESEEAAPEFVKRNRLTVGFVSAMWKLNVTPQSVVRVLGPWGPDVVKNLVQRRFVERGLNERECEILAAYLYHINADKPSGEYALNALLVPVMKTDHPGVYARRPLADMMHKLPENIPVVFMYGDRDWMFHPQVHEIVSKMPNAHLKIIDRAGHHVYFDNPESFNRELIALLE